MEVGKRGREREMLVQVLNWGALLFNNPPPTGPEGRDGWGDFPSLTTSRS